MGSRGRHKLAQKASRKRRDEKNRLRAVFNRLNHPNSTIDQVTREALERKLIK